MYRITVNSCGKYHNVTLGPRYCFFKKSAKELIDLFLDNKCKIIVEKFIRVHNDIFVWSSYAEDEPVLMYAFEKQWEIEENEE